MRWAALPTATAQTHFARAVEASLGAQGVAAVKGAAAVIYVAALAYVMIAALRKPGQARLNLIDFKAVTGLCSARK